MGGGYADGAHSPERMVICSLAVVPEFLSDEWIAAFDHAVRDADVGALAPFVVEQIVRDVPGRGEVRYRIAAADGHLRVARSAATDPAPDVSFNTDFGTAVALARGEENAQRALAFGRLRLGGDLVLLAARAEVLTQLDDLSAEVRAATTYNLG
jgi:hypothetical protein